MGILAERLCLKHPAVELVQRLEKAGLVAKRPSPEDRRAMILDVLPEGEARLDRADLFAALESAPQSTVLEAGIQHPVTIHADASLAEAADHMIRHGIGRIPVVDSSPVPKLAGLVTRRAILEAKRHQLELDRMPHPKASRP